MSEEFSDLHGARREPHTVYALGPLTLLLIAHETIQVLTAQSLMRGGRSRHSR